MFFCKQKTAYEMRISDWSSDVCSSDLEEGDGAGRIAAGVAHPLGRLHLFALRPLELRKAVGPAGVGAVGGAGVDDPGPRIVDHGDRLARRLVGQAEGGEVGLVEGVGARRRGLALGLAAADQAHIEIGRASCREKGLRYVEISGG